MFNSITQGKVLFDITEFVSSPHRTGIQRVTLETARYWPRQGQLVPIIFKAGQGFCVLPNTIWDAMECYFAAGPAKIRQAETALRGTADVHTRGLTAHDFESCAAVLCTEVFYCSQRVNSYHELLNRFADRVHLLLFDLFPWFQPEFFPHVGSMLNCMPYFKLLRRVQRPMYISEATRRDFLYRVRRNTNHDGPVISLGADSLGSCEPPNHLRPADFCMVGTIEPRKNHAAVLQAFKSLWKENVFAKLTFVGRAGWCDTEFIEDLKHLSEIEPRFTWISKAEDDCVKLAIQSSRATIFPSLREGFGIPPLESLALGTPVIVSADTPSIAMLPPLGQIRLQSTDAGAIKDAVGTMLDDRIALQKQREITQLVLPTWQGMVKEIHSCVFGKENVACAKCVA